MSDRISDKLRRMADEIDNIWSVTRIQGSSILNTDNYLDVSVGRNDGIPFVDISVNGIDGSAFYGDNARHFAWIVKRVFEFFYSDDAEKMYSIFGGLPQSLSSFECSVKYGGLIVESCYFNVVAITVFRPLLVDKDKQLTAYLSKDSAKQLIRLLEQTNE